MWFWMMAHCKSMKDELFERTDEELLKEALGFFVNNSASV